MREGLQEELSKKVHYAGHSELKTIVTRLSFDKNQEVESMRHISLLYEENYIRITISLAFLMTL